jgi:histidine triad (HIT) family protein
MQSPGRGWLRATGNLRLSGGGVLSASSRTRRKPGPAGKRSSCAFCEIVAGRAPAHVVDEDERSLCLLDIHPFVEGHCLVVSKRHVPWWHDLEEEEIVSLFRMARRVAARLRTAFRPEFVCLYARGRRIPHTHVFLVPTSKGDVLDGFFNALERFQESPEKLAAIKGRERLAQTAAKVRKTGRPG